MISNRPYLVRALYDWILDNDMTPYILVDATEIENKIPDQYINEDKIILNLHPASVINLEIGNEWTTFQARFSGKSHHIVLKTGSVLAIYAKENGMGMVMPEEKINTETEQDKNEKPKVPDLKIVK